MATKVAPSLKWNTPGKQPDRLQASADGLWVIDRIDHNDMYLLTFENGRELRWPATRALHSSDITIQ
jgi:hypothetical protein